MTYRYQKVLCTVLGIVLVLGLSGCKTLEDLGIHFGKGASSSYEPLSHDLARMASPTQNYDVTAFCEVGKGEANFNGRWKSFKTTRFKLPAHERVDVSLAPTSGSERGVMQAYFDYEGQKILFCPVIKDATPDQKIPCASLYMLEDDLKLGLKRTFDVPHTVVRGAITCADSQGHFVKL